MYLMIDNYDSYVYNLIAYMKEARNQKIDLVVMRKDAIDWEWLEQQIKNNAMEGILISPGPKHPKDYSYMPQILSMCNGKIPILGICLGHQMIAYEFGAKIVKGKQPMHGNLSKIYHKGGELWEKLPEQFQVTRYHSLVVSEEELPNTLLVDAKSEDGAVMGICHKKAPIYGVQFHPEAFFTQYGHELIENFIKICERRKLCQDI